MKIRLAFLLLAAFVAANVHAQRVRYKFYRFNCGRDHRLGQLWGK